MEDVLPTPYDAPDFFHFERPRLNNLFTKAVQCPLVIVCAGAGYGKTSAVRDFVQNYPTGAVWIQLSESDNVGARFWENYTRTLSQVNKPFAAAITELGFPETKDKINQYIALVRRHSEMSWRTIIMDDFHFIKDPAIIRFVENVFINMTQGGSLFLISRSSPPISAATMISRSCVSNVSEQELKFTQDELARYFRGFKISLSPESLHEIMRDTKGWVFAVNLIVRSYRKAPGYMGYLRNAMKMNIFQLMEREIWDGISRRLQMFLIRLSLIGHLSAELIELLAEGDMELIAEMERQSAYVRRDIYINAYLIHPLFLEFLAAKQNMLTEDEKRQTYSIAGKWCNTHGFKIDSLSYYEKVGDYQSITEIFIGSPPQIPYDIARFTAEIFQRAPLEVFDNVLFLASIHIRTVVCQGKWNDAIALSEFYKSRYLKLPLDEIFRTITLSSIYFCWGISRQLMCLFDDVYDFDHYYKHVSKCFLEPVDPGIHINKNPSGPWMCAVGSSRKGAPEEYLAALKRSTVYLSRCYIGYEIGKNDLAHAELMFYKGNLGAAEEHIREALNIAQESRQFGVIHRVLFFMLRLAICQGTFQKVDQAIKDMDANLHESESVDYLSDYDITQCWYYCTMGMPEKIPDWLTENFMPYSFAGFIENHANLAKSRYFYKTKNYPPLLAYMYEMRRRESYLFGRVEMLAMESCVHYKMNDKKKAFAVLQEAYEAASPNTIFMPFIELGKDMRTLTALALKEGGHDIPKVCLEMINRKSSTYAKRLAHIVAKYKQASGITSTAIVSQRESEILLDLSHGLSRMEIAAHRGISINTVKMIINSVYNKLGAENFADAIRIATERKVI
ncbi:MAG: LuxR C-terminal-related transcriptional regulator [Treponema sp.]|nr:LuxR C-terminal-related transcriptional regulator [Treponema sp.]